MHFIDTHNHLYADAFETDRAEVLQRAIDSGIKQLLLANIDLESINGLMDLSHSNPSVCYPMMGLHPCSVQADYLQVLEQMHPYFDNHPFIAVGEIGIDLYWDKTFKEEQIDAFKRQIQWAKDKNLPIAIHCRDAFDEIAAVLDEVNDEKLSGVFHCFSGSLEQANRVLDYGGFKLGIGGVLSFKNAGLDKVIEQVDMQHIILETDAPYLAPTPYRGKRNEAYYLLHIAEKLADIKGISLSEVAEITTHNAQELFKIEEYGAV